VIGRVTLVGAGPGDAELLTLRGLAALKDADVIVADRLGARAVLEQLTADGVQLTAEIVDVGKLPGHHPVPQDGINELLVSFALAGKDVVRLKGGDPFVFGRGREEQLFCEEHGIAVAVVPGVTSAISVPAVAGIPLTHRGVAASFTVVSGHDQIDRIPGGGEHTVVLLMGVNTLGHSAHVLAAGARGADCPVAIVEDGYGENQRVTIGTLGTITELAAARQVRSPAVIVVGDVVRLSPHAVDVSDVGSIPTSRSGARGPGSATHLSTPAAPSGSGSPSDSEPPTDPGSLSDPGPLSIPGSLSRPKGPRPHWTDAFAAGLAVDSGLARTALTTLTSR